MGLSDSEDLSDDFQQPFKRQKKTTDDKEDAGQEVKENGKEEGSAVLEKLVKIKKKKLYQCQHCPSIFSVKSNCTRHESHCSANLEKAANGFIGDNCNTCYSRKDNLNAHLKKCTEKSTEKPKGAPSKKTCLVRDCNLQFVHHVSLIEHLRSDHKEDVSIKPMVSKNFASIEEFNSWKEKEETETFSYFTKRRGTPSSGDQHFYCQHDGSEKVHSKRKTSRCHFKGRIKVGHLCIAKMIARVDPESKAVHLEYFPTHSHLCKKEDVFHLPLPDAMSRFIDKKLTENIPPTTVYELTKARFFPRNSDQTSPGAEILTNKRILERGRRRRMARRLHKDDAKAVFLMVKQLIETEDCILLYKPYGGLVEYGPPEVDQLPNSKELFMLGIQTQRQLELFKKHCNKIVILDETHGTNQYRYQLLTAMVVDENRRGWPIAHLITSISDGATLKFFFECLKKRLGDEVSVGCVITDDDAALINGMNDGFSEQLKHILCIWHVFKNVKEKVKSKTSQDLSESIMDEVKLLMNVKEENQFQKLCDGFLKKYENNPNAAEFVKYFQKYYLNRPEKWALCFRNFPHHEVNTTGHLESFHHRLKKFYLKRKVNKRLDDLITILLNVEWDDHLTRCREAKVEFSSLPHHIQERHQKVLAMEDGNISDPFLENTWEVKSATGKAVTCVVVRHKVSCNYDHCFSRCLKLECHGLCAHLYSCSCPDTHPLCKHIHKLHSYLTRGEPSIGMEAEQFYTLQQNQPLNYDGVDENLIFDDGLSTSDIQCSTVEHNEDVSHNRKYESMTSRLKSSVSLLQSFLAAAENKKVPEHTGQHADAILYDLVQGFGPMEWESTSQCELENVTQMTPAVKFTPNETLKTQMSQLASFKRPPKKKSKPDPALLAEKKKTAMESLLMYARDLTANSGDFKGDYECFTPSSAYVSDPLCHILVCGEDKISLVNLKSLELQLPNEEEKHYMEIDPTFRTGMMHASLVDAFILELCGKFEQTLFMPSHYAYRAANAQSNVNFLMERIDAKKVILVPANISEDQWVIFAVIVEHEEIRYYDPLQKPLNQQIIRCLSQTVLDLKTLYPFIRQWKIKVIKFCVGECDIDSGEKICYFATQTAEGLPYSDLQSSYDFRKTIYQVIVGNCLKRSRYFEETCGHCKQHYGRQDDVDIWISCSKCEQLFHSDCVGNPSPDTFFICP